MPFAGFALHSTIGRQMYDEERKAWLHEQETGQSGSAGEERDSHTVGRLSIVCRAVR